MEEINELIEFLKGSRNDLKEEVLKIILNIINEINYNYFNTNEIITLLLTLFKNNNNFKVYISNIFSLIIAEGGQLFNSKEILKVILNELLEIITINNINNSLIITNKELINSYLSLLTNLTINEENNEVFVEEILLDNKLNLLLEHFLDYNPQAESNEITDYQIFDPWQHFASILCNICRQEKVQLFLLNRSHNYLQLLLKQIRSKNVVRRRGVVGSIRSCLFKSDFHWWLVEELNITTPLLIPLVVNTPFTEEEKVGMDPILWMQGPDKLPEPDFEIQKMLLESLLILCHKRIIRERLRVKKVYPIIRNLDYLQEHEEVSAIIYEVVSQLIGNEDSSNPTTLESQSTSITTGGEEGEKTNNESNIEEIDSSNVENALEDVD